MALILSPTACDLRAPHGRRGNAPIGVGSTCAVCRSSRFKHLWFVTRAGAALEDHLQLSSMRVQPLAGVLLGGLMSEVATQRGVAAMIGW
jgi:hypothetical protein